MSDERAPSWDEIRELRRENAAMRLALEFDVNSNVALEDAAIAWSNRINGKAGEPRPGIDPVGILEICQEMGAIAMKGGPSTLVDITDGVMTVWA